MAPTITAALTKSPEHLTHKLRKPLVEKLRRERINTSIEQLKSLLGQGLKQQPDSNIEKADILEMTICILRQLQKQRWALDFAAVDHGYHVQETEHSNKDMHNCTQRRLTRCLNSSNLSSDFSALSSIGQIGTTAQKDKSPANSVLWRPW